MGIVTVAAGLARVVGKRVQFFDLARDDVPFVLFQIPLDPANLFISPGDCELEGLVLSNVSHQL